MQDWRVSVVEAALQFLADCACLSGLFLRKRFAREAAPALQRLLAEGPVHRNIIAPGAWLASAAWTWLDLAFKAHLGLPMQAWGQLKFGHGASLCWSVPRQVLPYCMIASSQYMVQLPTCTSSRQHGPVGFCYSLTHISLLALAQVKTTSRRLLQCSVRSWPCCAASSRLPITTRRWLLRGWAAVPAMPCCQRCSPCCRQLGTPWPVATQHLYASGLHRYACLL